MYNEVMENTDFVIEHIDKEVKVITDRPSSVVNYPANTDFFIENIDDNVISIAHSLNIEASEVEFRPANTDFFIENIDNNVIMIAESLELTPSEVTIRPANTDFFVENIDKNLIAIAEYYDLEPSRVVLRPANTDMFIENIDRNVTLIKSRTNVITKSGSFINVDVPDGGTMQLTAIDGNAEQTTYSGKNLFGGLTEQQKQYCTYTLSNNKITITPTDTTHNTAVYFYLGTPLPAGTYTLNSATRLCDSTQLKNASISAIYNFASGFANETFTLSETATVIAFNWLSTGSTTPFTIDLSTLQIEAGSIATPYEPYVGGIPAPNPQFPMPISTVTGEQTVKITGKNLFDNSTLYHGYFFDEPSALIADEKYRTAIIDNLPAGTYTFSCDLTNCYMLRWYGNGTTTTIGVTSNSQTITTTAIGKVAFCMRNNTTTTITQDVKCQLELGSTATAYEPYQGDDYEVNLGKNLEPFTTYDTSEQREKIYIPTNELEPETYTISFDVSSITLGTNTSFSPYFQIRKPDNTNIVDMGLLDISSSTTAGRYSKTFSLPSDATLNERMGIRVPLTPYNNGARVVISNIQLEKGSTATAYAPYFTPIELAKIPGTNYRDRIYEDGGKWYIEKQVGKVVLNGSEAGWGMFSNNNAFYSRAYDVQIPPSTATAGAIIANYYTANSETNIYNARVDYGIGISEQRRILVRNKDITTVTDFKTWLGTNKPSVYYALATPTTTEITDETLLEQLNFVADMYEGINNISLNGTGAQGTIEVVINKN